MRRITYLVSTTVADLAEQVNAQLAQGADLHGTVAAISNGRIAQAVLTGSATSGAADSEVKKTPAKSTAKATKSKPVSNPNGDDTGES